MSGLIAQPELLAASTTQYGQMDLELASVYAVLAPALQATGAFWGNDPAGQSFAAKYCPSALAVLQKLDLTHQGVQSLIQGIAGWAQNIRAVDDAVAAHTPTTG